MKRMMLGSFGIPQDVLEKIRKHREESAKLSQQNSLKKKEGFFKRSINFLKSLLR